MDGPIASAVVLPDEAPPLAKRRQSSISDDSAKRPRLEDDAGPIERRGSITETKPAVPVRRERGRERRLFGAVLGALSQNPSTTAAQKRRSEIEKRQLAQRKLEDQEGEQRKAERVARRKEQRWKEQRRFERESMRLCHDNLLNLAHFLRTETTPHLYYKPWETTDDEDERIQDQIAEARETIRRELEDYEIRIEQTTNGERRCSPQTGGKLQDAKGSNTGKGQHTDAQQPIPAANGTTNGDHTSPRDQDMEDDHNVDPGHEAVRVEDSTDDAPNGNHDTTADDPSKDHHDDHGEDVIEEAAEDTVIY